MIPLVYIGTVQAVFSILFLLSQRPIRLSDKILALWMFFLAMPLCIRLVSLEMPEFMNFPLLKIRSFPFTFGPFLYLYARSLIHEPVRIVKKDLLHFLPFLLFAVLQMLGPEPPLFPDAPNGMPMPSATRQPPVFSRIHAMTNILSFFIYTFLVFRMLKTHSHNLQDQFSYTSTRLTLSWLKWITVYFFASYMFVIIFESIFRWQNIPPPQQLHGISFTFFIFTLSFFGFRQPVIFSRDYQVEMKTMPVHDQTIPKQKESKYGKSGLTEDMAKRYLHEINIHMERDKPYLNPDLTIQHMSDTLNISRHHLTQVINEQLNKNFYLFVNEYRVEEAKRRMSDRKNDYLTMLAIAYDAGFNSKSGFNSIFKRVTGLTPSQYRKSNLPQ